MDAQETNTRLDAHDIELIKKTKKELIEMGEEGYYTAILKEYEQFKKEGLI